MVRWSHREQECIGISNMRMVFFLLEDVNELTEIKHFKTKPACEVSGFNIFFLVDIHRYGSSRPDSVVQKTVDKPPTTIHVCVLRR